MFSHSYLKDKLEELENEKLRKMEELEGEFLLKLPKVYSRILGPAVGKSLFNTENFLFNFLLII